MDISVWKYVLFDEVTWTVRDKSMPEELLDTMCLVYSFQGLLMTS